MSIKQVMSIDVVGYRGWPKLQLYESLTYILQTMISLMD